jgi:hypothetical protein
MDVVKLGAGASAAYLGVKAMREAGADGEPAVTTITFVAGSAGAAMDGETLVGQPEDDPEANPPEGVSFGLFVGKEVGDR